MSSDKPSIENAVQSLLSVNMGLQEDERLLILGDSAGDGGKLAKEVGEAAQKLHPRTRTLIFDPAGGHGQEPPREVWETLFGEQVVDRLDSEGLLAPLLSKAGDLRTLESASRIIEGSGGARAAVVVAVTRFSTSHTSFRKLLNQACGVRYASMPNFEREMFFGSMDVDWEQLAVSTNLLARALEGADRCEISSPNGTRLVLGIKERPVTPDDGMLTRNGKFGNLPAGEVFLAPVEGTAEGILVLEWGPLARFKSPLTVTIEGGKVVSVNGDISDEVNWLKELLSAHPNNTNIAELGIGTNQAATRPDNVLESEKILGTVHVAFGDNHTFGGVVKAPLHQDFVLFDATLVAVWETGGGRRMLLDNGKRGW
ncbi:MAG: aminopeptidase [bacterium]|nr:aminopeptidase [bacterium]MDT8366492.1 aminopeptidase [bacterium]